MSVSVTAMSHAKQGGPTGIPISSTRRLMASWVYLDIHTGNILLEGSPSS